MISCNFIFNFAKFCVTVSFSTKLLTLGILFSTAVRAVLVAKLVMLGTLFLTSFDLPLRVVLVAELVISGILSSIFLILVLYTSFLMTSFLLHHLVYFNQQEQALIYQHLNDLLYFQNSLNYLVHFSIYQYLHQILSLLNQIFLAKSGVSTPIALFQICSCCIIWQI